MSGQDYFPRSGGTLRVELGKQITNERVLAQLREYYAEWLQAKFRVEVFDCPERGFRNFPDRQSANQYRDSLIKSGVKEVNIRIVEINKDGAALRATSCRLYGDSVPADRIFYLRTR